MQRESNWRYYFIIFVTFLCLIFIWPTVRYVLFVFQTDAPQATDYESPQAYEEAFTKYEEKRGDLQRDSISLGLDLVGGVDVLLTINEGKTVENLLNQQKESLLRRFTDQAINATLTLNERRDALVLKLDNREDVRQVADMLDDYVDGNLFASYDENSLRSEQATTTLRLDRAFVRNQLRESIITAEDTIRRRVDEFGVTQPSVSLQEDTNSIRVQVPGESDPERVIRETIRPAQLEFYVLHEDNDTLVADMFEKAEVENQRGEMVEQYQLREDAALPTGYTWMPGQMARTNESTGQLEKEQTVYVVERAPAMSGEHLVDAWVTTNPASLANPIVVSLSFNLEGARQFRDVTKRYLGQRLAISLDGLIHSAPVLETVIPDGSAQIRGAFDQQEARDLALVLKAGALPADLRPEEKRAVGPTLGAESIVESLRALVIGATVITVFMVAYYGMAGVISILALILNVLVILACLGLFSATLTLSGIGGMILTLGMAVDANVLIYERIREELLAGRELRAAIRSGFGRAFSVIFDSNLTTLLAALVLLQFGEGSVQGFALTMAFGLLANLFTGLTVTFALCSLWYRMRGKLSLGSMYIFRNTRFDFIGVRHVTFSLSAFLVVASIAFLIIRGGPQMAVDFEGGVLSEVRIAEEGDQTDAIRQALGAQARVQRITGASGGNDYLVRAALETPAGAQEGDVAHTQEQLESKLSERYGEKIEFLGTTGVSSEVGQQFRGIAQMVIIAASLCILIYLWFRFEFVFGAAAVIALVHDLTITLGVITLLNVQVNLDIVSALMILLGFSVNDTIVIFDRIRENSHLMFGRPFKEICNSAMNRSLSRTIITSTTTIGVMAIMFFFGGHSLQPFALTLIIGGIIGTYSSDFLATPLVFWWNKRGEGRLVEQLGRKGAAGASQAAPGVATGAEPAPAGAAPSTAAASSPSGPPRRRGRR